MLVKGVVGLLDLELDAVVDDVRARCNHVLSFSHHGILRGEANKGS